MTQYQYDALNELLKTIDPLTGQTNFTYDGNGNLLTVQDANTHTTTYVPNSIDKVGSRKDALLNQETYQYDLNGNQSVYIDRKNQVAQYTYDGLDRLTQIQFADLSTITYTYDAGNRVTQIVDSINGTITRVYDGLDRLTSETTPQGSVSYTYDNANRRSTMTVAGQAAVNYTYDNANRLTQITQGTATVTIGYDNANRRTSLTLPNGVVVAYGYDAASRVTSITYTQGMTNIGNLTYTYDANGRRTSMGGSLAKVNLPAAIASATYNANNQLTNWNGTTLSYDLNGNMTYDGATTYTWDARNRLGAFGSTTFAYDSFGRRTRNATGTAFLYDGANAVQELSGSTVTANLLTGGVDEVFTRTDSAGTRNFLGDALGSTLALTDSTGAVQTQYSYEPFGKTTATGSASSSTFQYTGRENDGTGMYYYRARYYSPTLGRFISEDPLGFGGGDINLYAYVGNSPTNSGDPSGQSSIGGGFDDTFFNNLANRKPKPRPHCPSGLTCNAAGWPVEPGINLDGDALNLLAALMTSGISAASVVESEALESNVARAARSIEEWLGPGATKVESGGSDLVLRSADGKLQIRFDLTNPHGLDPHVNIETWQPRNLFPGDGRYIPVDNIHVFLKP